MKSETTPINKPETFGMGIRDVPDGKSRTTDNTGIWSDHNYAFEPISNLIGAISDFDCQHYDGKKPCKKPATCYCVYMHDSTPACDDHGKLGMNECFGMAQAIIDKDGLRVHKDEDINDILSPVCDHCHSFDHMTDQRPHLSNNGNAICNICYDKEMAKNIAEHKAKMRDEVFAFLDVLRDSGVTNMFGAGPYIMKHFPDEFTKPEARKILGDWMRSK